MVRYVSKTIIILVILVATLAALAAAAGLFVQDAGSPFSVLSVRGERAEIYGLGLYRYDSFILGSGYRGVDAVILLLAIPLLLLSVLAYFLYVYATMALGAAYNPLFLVYVAIFSSSLYGLVLLVISLDLPAFTARITPETPLKGIIAVLLAIGLLTLAVWLEAPLAALLHGGWPAELGPSTTLVTHALDLVIVVPAFFISAVLIFRRNPAGYLLAVPLLVLLAMLAPSVTAMTISQVSAGLQLTLQEMIVFVASFVLLGITAILALFSLLRSIPDRVDAEQEY